jgi:hypothetical protein
MIIRENEGFCCKKMHEAVQIYKFINYDMVDRGYDIEHSDGMASLLSYCPWCGSKLPDTLERKIFEVLKTEYGINKEVADVFHGTNLPEEFKTDEWWKKRGL